MSSKPFSLLSTASSGPFPLRARSRTPSSTPSYLVMSFHRCIRPTKPGTPCCRHTTNITAIFPIWHGSLSQYPPDCVWRAAFPISERRQSSLPLATMAERRAMLGSYRPRGAGVAAIANRGIMAIISNVAAQTIGFVEPCLRTQAVWCRLLTLETRPCVTPYGLGGDASKPQPRATSTATSFLPPVRIPRRLNSTLGMKTVQLSASLLGRSGNKVVP